MLDRQVNRVVVFDPALSPVRILGGQGEGPGELSRPMGMDVSRGGEVAVFDFQKSGFMRWDPGGELLSLRRPQVPFVSRFERTPHGIALESSGGGIFGQGEENRAWLGYVDAEDTTRVASREVQGPGDVHLESCGIGFRGMGRVLEPRLIWAYRRATGRLAVSPEAEYVIDAYEGTEKVRSIRRAVEPRAVTDEMARQEVGDGMTLRTPNGEVTCEAGELMEKRGVAPRLQTVDRLRFTPDGGLWAVRGHVEGEEPAIDVFDPGGAYVGTLPPGTPVPLLFLPDGRLVAEEVDELDVERLAVYRVDRSGTAPEEGEGGEGGG